MKDITEKADKYFPVGKKINKKDKTEEIFDLPVKELSEKIVENEKEKIIALLSHENPKVVAQACECLKHLINRGIIKENEKKEVVKMLKSLLKNVKLAEKACICLVAIKEMNLKKSDPSSCLRYIQTFIHLLNYPDEKVVKIALNTLYETTREQYFKDSWRAFIKENNVNETFVKFLTHQNKEIALASIKLLKKTSLFSEGSPIFLRAAIEGLLPYLKQEESEIQLSAIECLFNLSRINPHITAECVDLPLFFNLLKDEKTTSSLRGGIERVLGSLCCSPNYRQILQLQLDKGLITLEKESLISMMLRKTAGSVILFYSLLLMDGKQTLTSREKNQIAYLLNSHFTLLTTWDKEYAILILHKLITSKEEFLDETLKKRLINSFNCYLNTYYLINQNRLLELSDHQKQDIAQLFALYPIQLSDSEREGSITHLYTWLDSKCLSLIGEQKQLLTASLDEYLKENIIFQEKESLRFSDKQKHEVGQLLHSHFNYRLS